MNAAASARLCVETILWLPLQQIYYAAASARLCVETGNETRGFKKECSRLRAAVC